MSQSKKNHNAPISQRWQLRLEDAGDGSGDAILILPDDLLDHLNCHEGDVLNLSLSEDDTIHICKKS